LRRFGVASRETQQLEMTGSARDLAGGDHEFRGIHTRGSRYLRFLRHLRGAEEQTELRKQWDDKRFEHKAVAYAQVESAPVELYRIFKAGGIRPALRFISHHYR
jgi:hypothetical protein